MVRPKSISIVVPVEVQSSVARRRCRQQIARVDGGAGGDRADAGAGCEAGLKYRLRPRSVNRLTRHPKPDALSSTLVNRAKCREGAVTAHSFSDDASFAGRLAESLFERFPVFSELAHEERRSLTATTLAASLREIHRERFYGCRPGAELAALLARGTGLAPTLYRVGVGAMLLWALGLGPCPVEPTEKLFREPRAHQLAQLSRKRGLAGVGESSLLRGVSDAAAWIVDPQAPEPRAEQCLTTPSESSRL